MSGLYDLIDIILPFQWASHMFMKNALLAVLLVTPLFGLLGTMVVNNRMAFFSDALGHGTFTGIAIGAIVGLVNPVYAAVIFSVVFAVIITLIKNFSRESTDTIIGVFSSLAIALGLAIMSFGGSFNKYSSYLIGDLLSITSKEIAVLAIVFAAVILIWILLFNKLLLTAVNTALAASRGVKTLALDLLFTSMVAVVVTIAIKWVGLLLINSLLVLPAAAARNAAKNVRTFTLFSVLTALFSGLAGLVISYYLNIATGATIVLISGVIFMISLIFRRR
ncbi:MAG: metal ABC transporter permease [Acutalibacteraceae bacterium]|jgi:zinc transport system permease protein